MQDDVIISWLLAELEAGRNDSSLQTRFHQWLGSSQTPQLDYAQSTVLFLDACFKARIKATTDSQGRFVYVVGRILPQPQWGADE